MNSIWTGQKENLVMKMCIWNPKFSIVVAFWFEKSISKNNFHRKTLVSHFSYVLSNNQRFFLPSNFKTGWFLIKFWNIWLDMFGFESLILQPDLIISLTCSINALQSFGNSSSISFWDHHSSTVRVPNTPVNLNTSLKLFRYRACKYTFENSICNACK